MENEVYRDPELVGLYVKRCKCGKRPYHDRVFAWPFPQWIKCNCGRMGESALTKQEAIDNWNADKLSFEQWRQVKDLH